MKLAEFDMQMFLLGYHKTEEVKQHVYTNGTNKLIRILDKNQMNIIVHPPNSTAAILNTREFHTAIEYLLDT